MGHIKGIFQLKKRKEILIKTANLVTLAALNQKKIQRES